MTDGFDKKKIRFTAKVLTEDDFSAVYRKARSDYSAIVRGAETEAVVAAAGRAATATLPASVDHEWEVWDQGHTGACVGFATAGVLTWYFRHRKNKPLPAKEAISRRFLWMASKEMHQPREWGNVKWPSTFLESSGSYVNEAMDLARVLGCASESMLEWDVTKFGLCADIEEEEFYKMCLSYQVKTVDPVKVKDWKFYLATRGPIATSFNVDDEFFDAVGKDKSVINAYVEPKDWRGHAVAISGYRTNADGKTEYILHNSWSEKWGDKGFVYLSEEYVKEAFTGGFGVTLK